MPKKTPTNRQVMDRQQIMSSGDQEIAKREQLLQQLFLMHYRAALGEDLDRSARETLLEQLQQCLSAIAKLKTKAKNTQWIAEFELEPLVDVTPGAHPVEKVLAAFNQPARRRSSPREN